MGLDCHVRTFRGDILYTILMVYAFPTDSNTEPQKTALPAYRPVSRGEVTPSNPSRRATARVTSPLPVPTACRHCASPVQLVRNGVIYGKDYGEWPWAYLCAGCGAYVGLHPYTAIPLGTLATMAIRDARQRAKTAFSALYLEHELGRSEAYARLAAAMDIADVNSCHIGWFDEAECEAVIVAVGQISRALQP